MWNISNVQSHTWLLATILDSGERDISIIEKVLLVLM